MKREEVYNSFLENMNSGFVLFEFNEVNNKIDFVFLDVNKKFLEYFELTKGDIIGEYLSKHKGNLLPNIKPFLERISKIAVPAVYEANCLRTSRYFELSAYPFENKFIVLSIQNITRRKQLEKSYFESEENYRTLANQAPISIISFDQNGIIEFVNEYHNTHFCNGLFPKEQMLGKKFSEIELCQIDYCKEIEKVFDSKYIEIPNAELNIPTSSKKFYCNIRAVPLRRGNDLRGGIIIIDDINQQKQVEIELERKSKEQEILLDNVDFIIWFMKSSKQIGSANQSFTEFFGVDKEFIIGRHISDIIPHHEAEDLQECFKKVWKSKYPHYFDKFLFNKFGHKRLLKLKVTPKLDANLNVEFLVCSAVDITEQRRNEEEMKNLIVALKLSNKLTDERSSEIMELNRQLANSEVKLKESIAAKDKFFSIIAHDLISPFQGFISLTKYLSDNIDELEESDTKDLASALNKSAKNLHKLLENLLNWSRIQRGSINYNPELFDLNLAIDINLSIAFPAAESKKISIKNNIEPSTFVYSDLNIINTIIRNLLSNAIKFTKYGGNIELSVIRLNKNYIELYVKDNGVGMDQSMIERVFKLGQYSTTLGTANETGTGLGLVLCKELASLNKGTIRIESQIDIGSTFFVSIPIREVD